MMLTIYGLPKNTKYKDVKRLIFQECQLSDCILDKLLPDGNCLSVKIGVANEVEGAMLVRRLNGYVFVDHRLRVEPVGNTMVSTNQPRSSYHPGSDIPSQNNYNQSTNFQTRQAVPQNFNQTRSDYSANNYHSTNSAPTRDPWGQVNQWDSNQMGASAVPFQQQQSVPYQQQQSVPYQQQQSVPYQQQQFQSDARYQQQNIPGNFGPKESAPARSVNQQYPRRDVESDSRISAGHGAAAGHHRAPAAPAYGVHDKSLAIAKQTLEGRGRAPYAAGAAQPSPWTQSSAPQKAGQDYRTRFTNQEPSDYPRDDKRDAPFRKDDPYPRRDDSRRREDSPPRGNVLARRDNVPPRRDDIMPRRDSMMPKRDDMPPRRDDMPPRRDGIPPRRDDMPPRRDDIPPRRDDMPPRRDDMPPRRDDMPPRRDDMPPRRDDMPPRRDNMMARRDDMMPRRDDIMPRRDDMMPRRDGLLPRRDDILTKRDGLLGKKPGSRSPRRYSPGRRSPLKRPASPGRRDRSDERYSPSRNFETPGRFPPDSRKQVRPAYEPLSNSAPKQPNTGGYHPNMNESMQYPVHHQPAGMPNWQNDFRPKDDRSFSKHFENDRNDRMGRSKETQPHSAFDRSPKERFVNHSPSRSPRRSWATEKRRSPKPFDAPPPPTWPLEKNYPSEGTSAWNASGKKDFVDDRQGWKDRRPDQDFDRQPKSHADKRSIRHERPMRENERPMRENRDFSDREIQDHKDFLDEMDRRHGPNGNQLQESKTQRTLAVNKITERISKRYRLTPKAKDELNLELSKKIDKMFGLQNVSHNTILVKFENIYSSHDEDKILQDVTASLPPRDRPKKIVTEEPPRNEAPKPSEDVDKLRNKSIFKEQLKEKYKQTIEEIRNRMLAANNLRPGAENFKKICEELNMVLLRILLRFGEQYGPACDIKRRFHQAYNAADETKMLEEIREKVNLESRKRTMPETSMVPEKVARHSGPNMTATDINQMNQKPAGASFTRWDKPSPMPTMQQLLPAMFPPQVIDAQSSPMFALAMQVPQVAVPERKGFDLYLCKDDFEPITQVEAAKLKSFLVARIYEATASSGWVPNFIFKGLQGMHRYEVFTDDLESRNWLADLDFSNFIDFSGLYDINFLVYTSEELWFERAAIWLPGHSRCNNMNPLDKLKLQNKHVDNIVSISSWKKVKTIIAPNGTRLYVDMPPSAARALEQKKLSLSYELQKVTVILKAAAVDKVVFDAGLKDASIVDQDVLDVAYQKSPMPVLAQDPSVVKIGFKDAGHRRGGFIDAEQAKFIKELIIFKIFDYHSQPTSNLKTDFLRYGICQPGHFGVVPENDESKRWLRRLDLGKLGGRDLVVVGEEAVTKYLKMYIQVNNRESLSGGRRGILDRLRACNSDLRGLHIAKWKVGTLETKGRVNFLNVEVDLDSVVTMQKLNFILNSGRLGVTKVLHDYKNLREAIKRLESEGEDSYDVANMDLASNDSDFEMNDDFIQIDS